MKKIGCFILALAASAGIKAQEIAVSDSIITGKITVQKDVRIDLLASKQAANTGGGKPGVGAPGSRFAKGYRLMIINTNDRDLSLRIRSQLLQRFPEQKVYMLFKPPYIQVKFGNFVEKGEADRYKNLIRKSGIVATNIFAVPEVVEVKPIKETDKKEEK